MLEAATPQPKPTPGKIDVYPYVMRDIQARVQFGHAKYGTYLQAGTGRDALWDALQEAYDLVMYLRQAILERDGLPPLKETNEADIEVRR